MSTLPVLISAGAVLGKVNLVQLTVMVLMEAMAFGAIRFADEKVFKVSSLGCEGGPCEGDLGEGGEVGRYPNWNCKWLGSTEG
jgi:hypothetical protein